jgi:hypothetical protein
MILRIPATEPTEEVKAALRLIHAWIKDEDRKTQERLNEEIRLRELQNQKIINETAAASKWQKEVFGSDAGWY